MYITLLYLPNGMVYNSTIKNNNWNIELVQKFVIYFTINLIKNHFSKNRFKKSPITEYKKLRLIHSKFLRLFWCITLQNVSNPLFLGINVQSIQSKISASILQKKHGGHSFKKYFISGTSKANVSNNIFNPINSCKWSVLCIQIT